MLAVGLLRAAHEEGVRVPEDLSVVAMHDIELADFTSPPLTTIAMPMRQLWASAFEQLLAIIGGGEPSATLVTTPPVLMVRGSTAAPRRAA